MNRPLTLAAVQLQVGCDRKANLRAVEGLIRRAVAERGAAIVALPELFDGVGPPAGGDAVKWRREFAAVEGRPQDTADLLSSLAAELNIYIYAGSVYYRHADAGPVTNTTWVYDPKGHRLPAQYDKLHLARLQGADGWHGEEGVASGATPSWTSFDFGGAHPAFRAGMSICYDLRFPELFRALCAPDDVMAVFVPSAFYVAFGARHWQVLLRARAIENQVYVIAPNQCGRGGDGHEHYGHSLIVDPFGEILADAGGEGEAVVAAALDLAKVAEARAKIPARARRRITESPALLPPPEAEGGVGR